MDEYLNKGNEKSNNILEKCKLYVFLFYNCKD